MIVNIIENLMITVIIVDMGVKGIVKVMKRGMGFMTEKRFKVHSMIQGMDIGETMDLEVCEELIKKYGSSSDIELLITNNGKDMTYQEVVDLLNENEQLKTELKRCKCWLNSNKNDYQLTLAFIKSKGYSLKDVLEYEKELEE